MRLFICVQDFTNEIIRDEVPRADGMTNVEYAECALAQAAESYAPKYTAWCQCVRVIDEDLVDVDCTGEVDDPEREYGEAA